MVNKEFFDTLPDGTDIYKYTLSDGNLQVSILDFGATLQSICYDGVEVNLGFDNGDAYFHNDMCVGTTIGRYANRIAQGKFTLDGVTYDVGCNEAGRGHLHGGANGLGKHTWQAQPNDTENSVTFSIHSPDGEGGYPGAVDVRVCFLVQNDGLYIHYYAQSDRNTIINLTNHAYFNLSGAGNGDILDTLLQIESDEITLVNDKMIPTGEILQVAGTPFDFRVAKPIGRDLHIPHTMFDICGGYDANFIIRGSGMRKAASAVSPKTGIQMECYTDQPSMQLYDATFLVTESGRGTETGYGAKSGFCLETQHYADSPNHPEFPSTLLTPEKPFETKTSYIFSKIEETK